MNGQIQYAPAEDMNEMRAVQETLDFGARIAREGLPVIDSLESLPSHERCHFGTPVRFGRRRSDQCGHLELTSARLTFHGALDISVSWGEVVSVERTGHEVGVVLAGTPGMLRFCSVAICEAARAALIARHLAAAATKSTT